MSACRALFVVGLFSLVGCSAKIKYDQTLTIESNDVQKISTTSPSANHKVRVEISGDQPFTAYVVMAKDIAGKDADSLVIKPANALAATSKVNEWNADVVIPEKDEFVLCIVPSQKTVTVKVKMMSQ